MTKKIIFTTGGTGGHIFPAINLMKHFIEKGYQVLLVTDERGKNFAKNYSEINLYVIKTGTPTNKNFFKKILSYLIIFFSIIRSIKILGKEKPDLVMGFGGYVSFPICVASKFFKLPLVIYESNLILGRANKYLLPISKKVLVANSLIKNFPKKHENKVHKVGSILDKNIISFSLEKKINNNIFAILVIGGSQGAEIFGKVVPPVIKKIKEEGHSVEIFQQCIKEQKNFINDYYTKNNIKNYVFEFEKDILKFILSSNLVITRSGASTTSELVHTFTPFVAVPLPNSIDNHQYLNAKHYKDKGCCWLLEQDNFNSENLFNLIIETIKDKTKLSDMSENMKKNSNSNVYFDIENSIGEFI